MKKASSIAFALSGIFVLLLVADMRREPQRQQTARMYQAGIRAYHAYLHPITVHLIRCRYRPTCSSYSSQAVARFGIAHGLRLTVSRLLACRTSVPLGTPDPVPSR